MERKRTLPLATGAELRLTGEADRLAVVCVNGGRAEPVEGTWSASLEWLVDRLAPRFPGVAFAEVRYRVKSWQRLDWCIADARAAVRAVGAPRTVFVGYSMGGAVAAAAADEPTVEAVIGLAPWLPDRLSLAPLRGRRLRVIHGSLDRNLPLLPGVSAALSARGLDRARALGADGEYTLIRGAVHSVALRAPWGTPFPLPRARRWLELVAAELGTLVAESA